MKIKSQSGQILLEYMLLLVIAASLSALIVRQLASRSPEEPGVLVKKWNDIQKEIGKDIPDQCVGGAGGGNCSH